MRNGPSPLSKTGAVIPNAPGQGAADDRRQYQRANAASVPNALEEGPPGCTLAGHG